jgi:hypothetical protein
MATLFQFYGMGAFMKQLGLGFHYDETNPVVLRLMKSQNSFLNSCIVMLEAEGVLQLPLRCVSLDVGVDIYDFVDEDFIKSIKVSQQSKKRKMNNRKNTLKLNRNVLNELGITY